MDKSIDWLPSSLHPVMGSYKDTDFQPDWVMWRIGSYKEILELSGDKIWADWVNMDNGGKSKVSKFKLIEYILNRKGENCAKNKIIQ
jgi:hypothetical protein